MKKIITLTVNLAIDKSTIVARIKPQSKIRYSETVRKKLKKSNSA